MKHKKLFAILTLVCFMFTLMPVAAFAGDGVKTVTTQEQLRDALENGGKIILGDSISVTGSALTIESGIIVTLDLNGCKLDRTSDIMNDALLTNKGDLTIIDSGENGSIEYEYTGAGDPNFGKGNYTIVNRGTLTLESGSILNTTEAMSHMRDAIDNNSGDSNAILNINGGRVDGGTYIAIRQFANSGAVEEKKGYKNTVNVSGGEITGTRAIWLQLPNSVQNKVPDANINITGGTLTSIGYTSRGYNYKDTIYTYSNGNSFNDVDINISGKNTVINGDVALGGGSKNGSENVTITGGTFKNSLYGNIYSYNSNDKIEITGGAFTDLYVTDYLASDANVEIKLADNIALTEGVTIPAGATVELDLNGKTISQTKEQTAAYSMIDNKGTLIIKDSGENGTINYTDTGKGGNYVSNTIGNSGTLTVKSGTIANLSSEALANAGYAHAIDNSGALIVDGGKISNEYYSAIRIWCTTDDDTSVVINEGTIQGAVDFQNVNGNANKGTLTINDGTFVKASGDLNGAKYSLRLVNFGEKVEGLVATINGGDFAGGIIDAGTVKGETYLKNVFAVAGGTFAEDPSAYVDDSVYCVGENADGKYVVQTAHVFDQEVVAEEYLVSKATCEAAAVYNKSCLCGEEGTETFTSGTALGHTFNKEVVDAKYLKSVADCDNAAVYFKSCACGEASKTETFTNGEALGHDYGDWTAVDITTHKKVCKNDAAHVVTGDHDFNAENKCNACGLQKHTVTFKNVENETKVEVISGEVVAAPEDPTLSGMTFLGWYNGTEKYDFTKPVTADLTLVAKWQDNSNAGGNGGGSYVGGGSSSSSSSNKTESSTTTTVTPSGSTVKVETETKTESDGTKVETETTTTTTTTGETTKVETTTETKTDGTVVETTTTTDSKGETTVVEKTTETNDEGTKVETTVTTDAQGETATTVTATLDNGSAVTNNDEAVKVEVTKVEETVVTKVEEAVAADETVEVVGTADNAVSVSATNSSTGAAQSNFVQPMSVNVPVDKAVLDNVTDTSKLTMAKVVTNEDGTTELVYMGGSYDKETGTFNAKVDEDGDYILVEKADLVKIELTIDDTTVKHNDNHHEMDVAPKINAEEGRTELPLRYLGEALGFGIDWNNNVVTITKGDTVFSMEIGKEIPGFGTPYIDSDRTMVSARYISEMLGANVIWDPVDRQVIVVK